MFKIRFPLAEIKAKLGSAKARIHREMRSLNEAIGVKLLSFAQQDYRTKSRGGTGTDGITWKPLKASTVRGKNVRGKKNSNRKTTKAGKARPGMGSSAIGINTGLQQASASPGFKGPDGQGGNVLTVTETDVTVGYGREYSKYFDEQRPLLPTKLPEAWREGCEEIRDRHINKILHEELS